MKLEVGESLFYSWLRHVEKCQVVQMNWKPSTGKQPHGTVGWDFYDDGNTLCKFITEARKFYQRRDINIFENSDFTQLIRQAEIDLLGLRFTRGKPKVYAVDVAFHSHTLGYKDNVKKVMEKLLRATVCISGYFNTSKAKIIFAAPKIPAGDLEKLGSCVQEVNERIKNRIGTGFSVGIIANGEFGKVIDEVQSVSAEVADTSELFLRSYQLLEMRKKMS